MEVKCYGGPYHGKAISVKDGTRSLEVVEQQDPIRVWSLRDPFPTHLSPSCITVPIVQVGVGTYVAVWPDYDQNSFSEDYERWTDFELGKALVGFSKVVEELK